MEKKHLTLQDRQNIEQMLNARKSFTEIALALDKNKSTISKEVRGHNCGFLLRINACSKNIRRFMSSRKIIQQRKNGKSLSGNSGTMRSMNWWICVITLRVRFIATLGVVLPSFLIMLIIPRLRKRWAGHKVIRLAMRGIKPCLAGVIVATGIHLLIQIVSSSEEKPFDWKILLITAVLIAVSVLFQKYKKKPISPILLIVFSGLIGMLFLQ